MILSLLLLSIVIGLSIALWRGFTREIPRLHDRSRDMEARFQTECADLRFQLANVRRSIPQVVSERPMSTQVVIPDGMDRRVGELEHLLEGWEKLLPSAPNGKQSHTSRNATALSKTASRLSRMADEAALAAIVNEWWRSTRPDRAEIEQLASSTQLSVSWYAIRDIETSLQSITWNGPYKFSRSEKDGGWLFARIAGKDEVLAVPADPAYFQTTSIMSLVSRMFEIDGDCRSALGQSGMALRPCRFRQGAKEDQYVVISRGALSGRCVGANGHSVRSEDLVRPGMVTGVRRFPSSPSSPATQRMTLPQIVEERLRTLGEELADTKSKLALVYQDCECLRAKLLELERLNSNRAPTSNPVPNSPLAIAAVARRLDSVQQELRGVEDRLARLDKMNQPSHHPTNAASRSLLPSDWSNVLSLPPGSSGIDCKGSSTATEQLASLLNAKASLASSLRFSDSSPVPELVHLAVQGDVFSVHQVNLGDGPGITVHCIDCQRPLVDQMLFQLFLAVRDDGESAYVFLPPGTFTGFKFPRGYQLLMEQVPPGTVCLDRILRPAHLERVGGQSGYRVSSTMRVTYREQSATVKQAAASLIPSRPVPSNGRTIELGTFGQALPANGTS